MDFSKKSLIDLKQKYKSKKIKVIKLDMDKLHTYIKKNNLIDFFEVIHSSYALYYAKDKNKIFNTIKKCIKPKGLLLVSAPSEPHEMVNFINKIKPVERKILDTLKFYKKKLLPFIKKNSTKKIMLKKINYISFKKVEEFLNFWKNTTYYNASIESIVRKKLIKKKKLKFKKVITITGALFK